MAKQFFARAATYAEDPLELARLDRYVQDRGWDPALRRYAPGDWGALMDDAKGRRFDAICASFDGRWWFSCVTNGLSGWDRVLPKRGQPKGPAKGGVAGGRAGAEEFAYRLILERGPQTAEGIIEAIVAAELTNGSIGSVRNIVRFGLRGSDRLVKRRDRDDRERWRVRGASKSATAYSAPGAMTSESSSLSPTQVHIFAQRLAEGIVRRLLESSPEQISQLMNKLDLKSPPS